MTDFHDQVVPVYSKEVKDHKPPVYQRTPREYVQLPDKEVVIQAPPNAPSPPNMSLWVILIPALGMVASVLCSLLMFFTGMLNTNPWTIMIPLVMVAFTMLGGIVRYMTSRSGYKSAVKERKRVYKSHLDQVSKEICDLQDEQKRVSFITNPDLDSCLRRVQSMDHRLWERSLGDSDFINLRLGIGKMPVSFTITSPDPPKLEQQSDELYKAVMKFSSQVGTIDNVPAVLPLGEIGTAGVVGSRDLIISNVRSQIIQLATHHSPDQVKIVLTYPKSETVDWSWVRWLPHTWNEDHTRRFIASTPQESRDMLMQLEDALKARKLQIRSEVNGEKPPPLPVYVFIFADSSMISGQNASSIAPLVDLILNDGDKHGAYALFLTEESSKVPQGCKGIISLFSNQAVMTLVGPPRQDVPFYPDLVDVDFSDNFVRIMAPLKMKSLSKSGDIPKTITLMQMLGISNVNDIPVETLWDQNEPYKSLAAPLGVGAGGEFVYLDLHERAHGPHGLVAGATGSGKSELLQTLIASLSINYSPEEVAFVLIDYKGGGMANVFKDLPHQIGIITNLEGNQSIRALAAIKSELKRRQRMLDSVGVNHIDNYQRLRRTNPALEALPHLIIISDEFAELVQTQPEFMKELISAVRVGRSLGVHLILATQKPAGVVNEQIWGNARFRLCLRVEQPQDSKEMLKRPDAAMIRLPGRAYIQVGMDEIFELFQAGYAGATYKPGDESNIGFKDIAQIDITGKKRRLSVAPKTKAINVLAQTQLQAVVSYLDYQAETIGLESVKGPWLPPLPESVSLAAVRNNKIGWDGKEWRTLPISERIGNWLNPGIGVLDDPHNQSQEPFVVELGTEGHLLIYGGPASGKTTLLRTIITSLIMDYTPKEVNFYLVDFGGRMMQVFEPLPHVGAVILPEEVERLERLVSFLRKEMDQRKALLSSAGAGSLVALRAENTESPPDIVVVVDNYTELYKTYPELSENFERFAREGLNLGIHLVLSANTTGGIPNRVSSNCSLALALELADPTEYSVVVGRTEGLVPERGVAGRGLVNKKPPLEFHTALPVAGNNDQERTENLKALIRAINDVWEKPHARPILELPTQVPLDSLLPAENVWKDYPIDNLNVPIGLDSETMDIYQTDVTSSPHFLITGAMGGGKTTLLRTWLLALAEKFPPEKVNFYLLGLGSARLLLFSKLPHSQSYVEDNDALAEVLENISNELNQRREALQELRRASDMLVDEKQFISNYPTLVMACDDYDLFRTTCNDANRRKLDELIRIRGLGFHLIVAGPASDFTSSMDPIARVLKGSQCGFLVGTNDGTELSILNLRPIKGKDMPPGRAYFGRRGKAEVLQVASSQIGDLKLDEWIKRISEKKAK